MKISMYTLIALWLWCVAAAGDVVSVTESMLRQDGNKAVAQAPCNWDKDMSLVSVTGYYGETEAGLAEAVIEPVGKQQQGSTIQITIDPSHYVHAESPLHHIDIEMGINEEIKCKEGFGFTPKNFVK